MANVTVVQAFITAFGSGDAQMALGQLHDDVQVSEPASLPIGGEYAGKAAYSPSSPRSRPPTTSRSTGPR
jgi:hypothetical protein